MKPIRNQHDPNVQLERHDKRIARLERRPVSLPDTVTTPYAYAQMHQSDDGTGASIPDGTTDTLQFEPTGANNVMEASPPIYFNSSGDFGAEYDLIEFGPGTYIAHLTVAFQIYDASIGVVVQVNTVNTVLPFVPMGRTKAAFAPGGNPLNTFQIYDANENTISTWFYLQVGGAIGYTAAVGNGLGVSVNVINSSGGPQKVIVGGATNPGGWTGAGSSLFVQRIEHWVAVP